MAPILCCWRPYCAVGIHIVLLASILCRWRPYCAVGVHIVILCCWRPYFAVCVPSVLVLLLASLYYFWHAVTGFPAVEGVLSVSSVSADSGVPILAGCCTYWILE